jgi:hypothetical protein
MAAHSARQGSSNVLSRAATRQTRFATVQNFMLHRSNRF